MYPSPASPTQCFTQPRCWRGGGSSFWDSLSSCAVPLFVVSQDWVSGLRSFPYPMTVTECGSVCGVSHVVVSVHLPILSLSFGNPFCVCLILLRAPLLFFSVLFLLILSLLFLSLSFPFPFFFLSLSLFLFSFFFFLFLFLSFFLSLFLPFFFPFPSRPLLLVRKDALKSLGLFFSTPLAFTASTLPSSPWPLHQHTFSSVFSSAFCAMRKCAVRLLRMSSSFHAASLRSQ